MPERREMLVVAGLALLGAGGLMLLHNQKAAPPTLTDHPGKQVDDATTPTLPGPGGSKIPGTSAAPPSTSTPPPAIAAVQAIVAKINAAAPYYQVLDAQGRGPIPIGPMKVAATANLQDAIGQANVSPCESVVRISTGGGIVYTHHCGIATRQTYVAPPPPAPSPPKPIATRQTYRPPTLYAPAPAPYVLAAPTPSRSGRSL